MKGLLLDTHVAIWLLGNSPRLSKVALEEIERHASTCYFSILSAWEIAMKRAVRKDAFRFTAQQFVEKCEDSDLIRIPILEAHVYEADALPLAPNHRDPFDRLLLAQARVERLTLLTHDRAFEADNDPCVKYF